MRRSDELAAGLATALLAGAWSRSHMTRRARLALGRRTVPRRLTQLIAEVAAAYRDPPAERPRELAAFLQTTGTWPELVAADRHVRHWTPVPTEVVRRPWPVRELPDLGALARLLDVDQGELAWFADVRGWERTCAPALRHYTRASVPKRGGERLLAAPKPRLKEIQRRLLRHVLTAIPVHDAAHGGVTGRSVRTATEPHAGAVVIVRFDLAQFFASVAAARVWGILRVAGLPEAVAHTMTGLLTTVAEGRLHRPLLARPHLPQGAPTSPRLANVITYRLDRRLAGLAHRFGMQYTRYIDDLTFTATESVATARLATRVDEVVRAEGLRLNPAKTVVLGRAGRQQVQGAVLNAHPAVARSDRDRLRAILHNCALGGWAGQAGDRTREEFRAHLLGRVAWVGSLHHDHGRRLRIIADGIDWG